MAEKFEVTVPIQFEGSDTGSGGSSDSKGIKELNKNIKKLDKTVYGTLDIVEMLSSLLGDVYKIIRPIFKLLSLLFLVFFMPFMPLIKDIMQVLATIIAWFAKVFKGDTDVSKWLMALIGTILMGLGVLILFAIGGWVVVLLGAIAAIIIAFWDEIKVAFVWMGEKIMELAEWLWNKIIIAWSFLKNVGMWIWDKILKPAFDFLKDVGLWIWNKILKPAFDFLKDVGTKIWNIIKSPFKWLARKVNKIVSWIIDKLPNWLTGGGRATGGQVNPGTAYMVGEQGPEMFMPRNSGTIIPNGALGGTNININASVRNDGDIKKIANEVSKVLYRQNRARFS